MRLVEEATQDTASRISTTDGCRLKLKPLGLFGGSKEGCLLSVIEKVAVRRAGLVICAQEA